MTNPGQGGDQATDRRERFEALTTPLMPVLFRGAVRLTHDRDRAADLLQEAFLRAFRTFDNFTAGTNAKAWLFKIMYSVFVNDYRKRQREPRIDSIEALETRYERSFEIEDWKAYLDIVNNPAIAWSSAVGEALDKIPEHYRTAVVLVDVEELTYEEAATVSDCKVGTVRSRLSRGRRLLAAMLQEYGRKHGYLSKESGDSEEGV